MSEEKKQEVQKINPLKQFEQAIATAKGVKDLLKVDVVKNRYIANYEGISGRSDGLQVLEQESFAFIDLANSKPEIMECDPYSIVAGFLRASTFGLSFAGNALSVYPRNVKLKDGTYKKMLVVEPQAHGKRRMLEKMPAIKEIVEGVIVFKDDKLVYDAKAKKVISHSQVWPQPEATEDTVIGAYCTVKFSDGTEREVLLNKSELKKARAASKMTDGGDLWVKYYGEACKKTTYNRAFKVYYDKPQTDAIFTYTAPDESTIDTTAEVQDESSEQPLIEAQHTEDFKQQPEKQEAPLNVNEQTGQVYETEEVKSEPRKKEKPKRDAFI